MPQSHLIEEYTGFLNQTDSSKANKKSDKIPELEKILGIKFRFEENKFSIQHVLTLPISLDEFNLMLNVPNSQYLK